MSCQAFAQFLQVFSLMKYVKIRMETQKFLFFQILNLKTKVKIKNFTINTAKQVILVERLAGFICCADKSLLHHLGLDKH